MSHRIAEPGLLLAASLAFLAFSLLASGTYILNDLLDLRADRRHPRKRSRPFAAGHLQVRHGVLALVLLIAGGIAIATLVSPLFVAATVAYLFLTVSYSLWWKRIAVFDVFVLALLYTLRILAGAAAVTVVPSFWLLAFSMFVFLSLAVLKRFVELRAIGPQSMVGAAEGRGYLAGDVTVLSSLGVAAGVVAALVLALYVDNPGTHDLYTKPWLIWLVCPMFLYWISRTWLKAHRGEVHDDPVVFALTDRISLLIAALTAGVFYLAT
jgi:4-hydroxybenzoate polyprenyltransferase